MEPLAIVKAHFPISSTKYYKLQARKLQGKSLPFFALKSQLHVYLGQSFIVKDELHPCSILFYHEVSSESWPPAQERINIILGQLVINFPFYFPAFVVC